MSSVSEFTREVVFSDTFNTVFDETVIPVLLQDRTINDAEETLKEKKRAWVPDNADNNFSCSYCRVTLPNIQQQREHYRLDWHRYNLKQSLQSKQAITEEEFSRKTEEDDLSSISGSGSEEEEQETLDTFATAQGKIFLKNHAGQVFSLYRCLLLDKKEEPSNVDLYQRYKTQCVSNQQWTILMLGGGHFAGAVFASFTPVVHKTFHCYTVRAGQGGSQSSKDSKSGGSHPKSAGASLRRFNEQALVDHVQSIVELWSEEIKKSSLIFYRASGPYNRSVLFGGKVPLLDKNDPRLRTIPFSTGRATFTEAKRVHAELCSVLVYESLSDAAEKILKQKSQDKDAKRNKARSSCINRAKSREVVERRLPTDLSPSSSEENLVNPNNEEQELSAENLEVSFEDLEEFGDSLTPEQRRNKGHSKKKPRKSKNQKLREKEEARKKNLIEILVKGNVLSLQEAFKSRVTTFEEGTNVTKSEIASEFFNETLDDRGNSFLHLAAMNEHEEMVAYLLENEGNPCVKNKNQQTPYACTGSKVIRDAFRKFAKENPEKFNYNKANIPLNALTEEEIAEKKKVQRKFKREKEKEKKKENHTKRKEQDEKNRFLKLSDREKRALAAERRVLSAQGKITARCFLCGADMAGKVPFEYLENRFCSVACLQSHRLKTTMTV